MEYPSEETPQTPPEMVGFTGKERPKSVIELSDDLTIIKIVLGDLIKVIRDGQATRGRDDPTARGRAIIITQLQLVRGMVHETQMEE